MKEPWEFYLRYPTFYANNPNPKGSTYQVEKVAQNKMRPIKVKNKYNMYEMENVCITLKEICTEIYEDNQEGLVYRESNFKFLRREAKKAGLELVGLKMYYLDEEQVNFFEKNFGTKLQGISENCVITFIYRGTDAYTKLLDIIGHFNPDMAKITKEHSIRSYFGRDKIHNSVFSLHNSVKKNWSELVFWFGGRVVTSETRGPIIHDGSDVRNTCY
jgi:nucleoside diphosphate kinase